VTQAQKSIERRSALDGAAKINTGEFCKTMHFVLVDNRVVGDNRFWPIPTRVDFFLFEALFGNVFSRKHQIF
jgi:hypothetical protein